MENKDSEKQFFTVTVFSENVVGLLSQITNIFTRRGLNIESLTACASSIPGVHKLTMTTWSDRTLMLKVVGQIEKRIEILRAFLFTDDEIVYQEVALFKVPTKRLVGGGKVEDVIRRHGARILDVTPDFMVIEKTGHSFEIETLFEELKSYEVLQFVRSGRISVTKSTKEYVTEFLDEQARRRARQMI